MLYLLLALTLVRGVLYAVLNPPFGSPDERDHFQYVQHLATGGAVERGAEGLQPVPYYAMMVPAYWLTAGQTEATQLLAIRLLSLPFLLGVVLFTWLAARGMAPEKPLVWFVATGLVALHPQLAYIGASANNDGIANLEGAILTYLAVRLATGSASGWTLAAAVLAIGLAPMTKGQVLPMAAVSTVVLAGFLVRKAMASGHAWKLLIAPAAILLAVAALSTMEGAAMLRTSGSALSLLGDLPGMLSIAARSNMEPFAYLGATFWAAFLHGEAVRPHEVWYIGPAMVVAIGLLGYVAVVLAAPDRKAVPGHRLAQGATLVAMLVVVAGSVYLRYLYNYQFEGNAWRLQILQGRFLLVALLPLALLVANGWALLTQSRGSTLSCSAVLGILAAFDASSLVTLLGTRSWS